MDNDNNTERLTPLDVLRRDGWRQYRFGQPIGEGRCLVVASSVAAGTDQMRFYEWNDAALDVVCEQFPERRSRLLYNFNDHEDTTWDDIVAVCEKTELRLSERVA